MERTITTRGIPARGIFTKEAAEQPWIRATGNARSGHLETAPTPRDCWDPTLVAWVPERIEGRVTVDATGDAVEVECPFMDEAGRAALGAAYRRELRDAGLVRPETGRRYRTGRYWTHPVTGDVEWIAGSYVALDRHEAERLAAIDGKSLRVDESVEVVHAREGDWALWSDGLITTAIGLPRWAVQTRSLSTDAHDLISACRGSDSGAPSVGYAALIAVEQIERHETLSVGQSRGCYARATVERLTTRLRDGSQRNFYTYSAGYCEGYAFEVYGSFEELRAASTQKARVL